MAGWFKSGWNTDNPVRRMGQNSRHRCLANQTVTAPILRQALANEIQRAAAQAIFESIKPWQTAAGATFNPSVGDRV